jgi:hypothetical protein
VLIIGGLVWFASASFPKRVPLDTTVRPRGQQCVSHRGLFFLILHDHGTLAAPFATSTGWGDILSYRLRGNSTGGDGSS